MFKLEIFPIKGRRRSHMWMKWQLRHRRTTDPGWNDPGKKTEDNVDAHEAREECPKLCAAGHIKDK